MEQKPKKSLPSNEPAKPALPAVRPTAEAARFIQTEAVPASLYRHLLAGIVGKDETVLATVTPFVRDLVQRFKPRDPVEEMLIVQLMLSHLRTARLSLSSFEQQNLKWASMMHEAADRAANTFRRQMLALAEYRRPPRSQNFTAIGQANIAAQQVVANQEISKSKKVANEQGSPHEHAPQAPQPADAVRHSLPSATPPPAALPADASGAGGAAGQRPQGEAVGEERRPQDGRG